ncbi:MAG: SIMPL domain-containing protein [Clostridiales bacterium]|nr:SIMPL domain-containing protein [Clostridiales bacterium]
MERTIRVTGKGKLSLRPDQIRLLLELCDCRPAYDETIRLSAEHVEALKDTLAGLGFDRKDLKTTYYNVDSKYERYQARDKSWKNRFIGYECTHKLKLEFDADNELLGKVLYALAHSPVAPEFKIVYTVKDEEAAKNQLLARAVADSKEKARVLTEAAGVTLADMISIDYSWGEIDFSISPVNKLMDMSDACCVKESAAYDMDIEPDDIDVADTVTILWGIR